MSETALVFEEQQAPMSVDMQLRKLDVEISTCLGQLPRMQRKFALELADGKTGAMAARAAGYSESTASSQATRLLNNVVIRKVADLLNYKAQLDHGINAAWKRKTLQDIAAHAGTPGDDFHPGSAVSAVRCLAEMDGDIRGSGSGGGITINITTGIQRDEKVIEHEDIE